MSKTKPGHLQSRYEVISQKDDEDILIPIPPVLLTQLGWKEGDEVSFALDDRGRYIIQLLK